MRIVFYELYKLFCKKALISMFILLSLLNLYILWNRQASEYPFISDQNLAAVYRDISKLDTTQEKLEYLAEKYYEFSIYFNLSLADMDGGASGLDYSGRRLPEYIGRFESGDYSMYSDNIYIEYYLYQGIYDEVSAAAGYGEFLERLETNAESMIKSSLLAKPDSFAYQNIIRTPPAYEHLKGITPSVDIPYGIERATDNKAGDLIAVLLVLMAVFVLFLDEKESGAFMLTRTLKNGRGVLLRGKIAALFIWCAALAAAILTSGLLLMSVKFGLGDLTRQLQSVNLFTGSILNVPVMSYLFIYAAVKAAAYFIFALIAVLICVLAKNSAAVYMAAGAVIAAQILPYAFISPLSEYGVFKFLNIAAFTQPNEILQNYFNINAFGRPLNIITASAVTAAALITVLIISLLLASSNQAAAAWDSSAVSDFLSKFSIKRIHVGVLRHEVYKTFIFNRALLILLLLAAVQFYAYNGYRGYTSQEELYYKNYVERAGGAVTQETWDFIDGEQARFDEIGQSLLLIAEMYENGELSADDYRAAGFTLQQMLSGRKGFEMFRDRAEYVRDIHGGQIVYDKGFNTLFGVDSYDDDMSQALLIIIFIVLIVSPVFASEKENGMVNIIKPTPKGLTWLARFCVSFAAAVIALALVNLPFIINTLSYHGAAGNSAVVQSLPAFSEFPLPVSVRVYMALLLVTRILGAAAVTLLVLLISRYSNKKTIALLISLAVLAIPAAAYFIGVEFFAKIGVNSLLGGNAFLR